MSLFKIIAWIAFVTTAISHMQCVKNANLWKSIQYQLKLVESSEGRCDCGSQDLNSHKMVGFLVRSSKHIQNFNGVVVYDTVITNTGSSYNPSNGNFIAHYEGLYFISWTTLTEPNNYFITDLIHNSKQIVSNHASARGVSTEYMTATQSVVLQLAAKDEVFIKSRGTQKSLYGQGYSTFTGFKI
ncbi:complement C1q-like protein 3 [Mytilus californianus]|uniref:complement C1q-like protein 3 n=1 Tax=Mytilus californianus TaxID=6549 RepID=UPI00224577CB|nr:complement C1q-like protein 3 [Mytilus californianus]